MKQSVHLLLDRWKTWAERLYQKTASRTIDDNLQVFSGNEFLHKHSRSEAGSLRSAAVIIRQESIHPPPSPSSSTQCNTQSSMAGRLFKLLDSLSVRFLLAGSQSLEPSRYLEGDRWVLASALLDRSVYWVKTSSQNLPVWNTVDAVQVLQCTS